MIRLATPYDEHSGSWDMTEPVWATVLAVIAGIPLWGGCSGSAARQAIQGVVTVDGQPLEKGQITFVPLLGTQGPTAGAAIIDGRFTVARVGGPFVGKFRVEITASRPGKEKTIDRISGKPVESFEQYIPRKYNAESQLEAEVKAGEANRFEYALTTK